MPPVEIETIPSHPVAVSSYKTFDKAMELPIVNDAVTMATKLHEQATHYPTYNQVEAIVTNGIQLVDAGLSQGVKTTVASAVTSLDTLASTGLDKLTTTVPALATPTDEILPNITGTISASTATDYVASFALVQSGLHLADTALSLGEKALRSVAPSTEETTIAGFVIKQVRVVRRALRAIRHAGRRRARLDASPKKTLNIGWILEMFQVNAMLGFFGLSLAASGSNTEGPIATSGKRKLDDTVEEDDETLAEKLVKDYGNDSQDPDYLPSDTSEDSLEYKSDEEALDASQDETQESTQEETQESTQEETQESTQEETQESTQE